MAETFRHLWVFVLGFTHTAGGFPAAPQRLALVVR